MGQPPLGQRLPELKVPPPGPASRRLARRLRAVESRNVTHVSGGWPVFWEEARGANVLDADGNVYLDLTGAFGVALLGHGHPGVLEAVEAQSRLLLHGMGDVHPPTVKLGLLERLAGVAPWPEARVVLSSTGSEAVETALKTALMATGRPGILAFEGAYHGLTLGSLAATDRDLFRGPFARRLYQGVAFAPFPDPVRHGAEAGPKALGRVAELLAAGTPNGDPIGAVIVEPVQGRAGARVAPDGFMARLSSLASEAGALVVADEIFSGMGRCGALFASQRVGLRPDIICLGKALGGGLPISACLAPAHVMDAWPESSGEAIHTSTFLGHPLSCAAAEAVLQAVEIEGVVERSRVLGGRLVTGLRKALAGVAGVADIRGLGLLVGIELADERTLAPLSGAGARAAHAALAEGVLLLPAGEVGHVVELTPSVELTDEQVAFAVDVVARAVRTALR
ncbi:MAG TPA: aspartate aminotransferase family protein [Longimicrobiales bacterium]|nr:aspartate aminotransferase family protein [Longimicrobiales bacterium]